MNKDFLNWTVSSSEQVCRILTLKDKPHDKQYYPCCVKVISRSSGKETIQEGWMSETKKVLVTSEGNVLRVEDSIFEVLEYYVQPDASVA